MMYNKKHEEMKQEAIEAIINALEYGYSGCYCDMHQEVFNTNYYIVGTYEAKEALKEYDVFEAIELVQNYEEENFGEIYTKLSDPEKLISMVWYIIGEKVAWEMYDRINAFSDNYDNYADDETNEVIVAELKQMYNI